MMFPFPFTGYHGQRKSSVYGGSNLTRHKFAVLDITNGNYTQDGYPGYNSPRMTSWGPSSPAWSST